MLTIFQFINMVYFVQHVHGAPRKRIKSGFAYEKVSPLLYNFIHFSKRTENKKTANKTYTNFSFRVLFETVRSEKLRCTIERGDERSKLIDTLFGREINNIILLTARQQSAKCVKLAIGFNDQFRGIINVYNRHKIQIFTILSLSRQFAIAIWRRFQRDIPIHRTFLVVTLFANVASDNQPHGKTNNLFRFIWNSLRSILGRGGNIEKQRSL